MVGRRPGTARDTREGPRPPRGVLADGDCTMTTRDRPLPDFVVIGALRAGTTTLYSLLSQIPGICLSMIKETDFFVAELNFKRGPDWYAGLFPRPDLVCGDISPNYSTSDRFPGVAERLQAQAPHAKIIYLVRDPVERARSHYQHTWLKSENIAPPEGFLDTPVGAHIVGASCYYEQVKPFVTTFGRDNVLILDFDELRVDPRGAASRVAAFVGVDLSDVSLDTLDTSARNASQDLAAVPAWWIRATRWMETSLPKTTSILRRWAPSSLRRAPAQMLQKNRKPPSFDTEISEELCRRLRDDAERFRALVGMRFESWRV